MIAFKTTGPANTDETLRIAVAKAKEHGYDIVAATNAGDTIFRLLDIAKELDYQKKIVAVTHVYGMKVKGENDMTEETFSLLRERGVTLITAAHALSGAERGLSSRFHGIYPVEIVAASLRMFGQGTKVCVEIALMALDNGAVTYGQPVICIGGSSRGADTACVITPGYTASLLDTKIHEILCKPELM